jgi:hypothetical protein
MNLRRIAALVGRYLGVAYILAGIVLTAMQTLSPTTTGKMRSPGVEMIVAGTLLVIGGKAVAPRS